MSIKTNFVIIPLSVLIFFTVLSLITGNNFISTAISDNYEYYLLLNGTLSELELEGSEASFSLDPITQSIIWITVIGGIAIASSITVLSSGISESGTRWIVGIIFFTSLWLMLSTLPYPLIISSYLGTTIYFLLTFFYATGSIWILLTGSE